MYINPFCNWCYLQEYHLLLKLYFPEINIKCNVCVQFTHQTSGCPAVSPIPPIQLSVNSETQDNYRIL